MQYQNVWAGLLAGTWKSCGQFLYVCVFCLCFQSEKQNLTVRRQWKAWRIQERRRSGTFFEGQINYIPFYRWCNLGQEEHSWKKSQSFRHLDFTPGNSALLHLFKFSSFFMFFKRKFIQIQGLFPVLMLLQSFSTSVISSKYMCDISPVYVYSLSTLDHACVLRMAPRDT